MKVNNSEESNEMLFFLSSFSLFCIRSNSLQPKMVHKGGASTSSEQNVEKSDDISKNVSAHDGQKSDDESTTTTTNALLSTNITKTPPKIADNGINLESKRKLRTSRRLNSLNPDLLPQPSPLPLPHEKTIDSTPSSNHLSQQTKLCGSAAAISAVLAQPLCAPKPIRNRRYTINECSNATGLRDAKDITVPFQAKNKSDTIVLNNCLTTTTATTTATITAATTAVSNKSDRKRSCDDLNLLGDRLNCSVSLERLTGIIDTLVYQTNASSRTDKDDASGGTNKILCLYCDRSFSSQKLYGKHLERLHQSVSGRRLSARTSNSETAGATYPGCFYCNSGKVASVSSGELIQLVYHLVDEHRDKYFACKSCMIRYPSRDQLQQHLSKEHKIDNNRKSSSSLSKRNAKKVQSSVNDADATSVDAIDDGIVGDEPTLRSLRLRRSNDPNKKTIASTKPQLLTTEETFLSRLGIAQNRSPRSRKGAKNRRGCSSELFPLETSRASRSSKNGKSTQPSLVSETIEFNAPKVSNNKCEPVASVFDEDFYESVNLNVKLNLSCHLDGKLETDGEGEGSDQSAAASRAAVSAVDNVPAVRSILVKSPVFAETEIHEATTTISAFTAFPTLLTAQQYGAEFQAGKMKKPITKNSWKWKWDCVKKYKYVNEGGKIVKKVKQPLAGLRDLSKLDMWTQLTMRTKHEKTVRQENEMGGGDDSLLAVGEAAREEKRKLIAQLNQILDKRVLPQINVEQSDQTIIKIEFVEQLVGTERTLLQQFGGGCSSFCGSSGDENDIARDSNFPASLRLFKRDRSANASKTPIVLSGEWARPRCYICVSCGSRFSTVRSLEEHKASKHPFVHSTHYEIVGKELIDGDLFRNFYIPSMALQRHTESQRIRSEKPFFGSNVLCGGSGSGSGSGSGGGDDSMDSVTSFSLSITKSDSIDLDSSSRNSKVSLSSTGTTTSSSLTASNSIDDENANNAVDAITATTATVSTVKCSKCQRECNGTMDLYRHMLDCSSDYAWLLAKKRNHIKYRYFGSRRRRTHRNSSSNTRKSIKPKKERDTTSDGASSTSKSKEPTTPRPRPSDGKFQTYFFAREILTNSDLTIPIAAESIQRMLENLPAKRAARQIFPNLTPKPVKSKRIVPSALTRGGKILVKQKTAGGNTRSYKILSTSTTINTVGANLVLRKRRNVDQQLRLKRSTDAAGIVTIRRTRAAAAADSESTGGGNGDSKKKMTVVAKKPTRQDGKNELGNVIRRRTQSVVKKIASTFRKGNKKHIIRTATASTSSSAGGVGKGTTSNPVASQSNEPQKKRKLLRSISFRRSTRNIRKSDIPKLTPKVTTAVTVEEESDAKVTVCEKQSDDQIPCEKSIEEAVVTDATKQAEANSTPATVAETVPEPPPKLKRKRSIKTIINDIRAKCQSITNAKVTENETTVTTETVTPLPTVAENGPMPLTSVEPKPLPLPITIPTPKPKTTPQMPVTSLLSLTIETSDEPLNLCVASRERNEVDKIVTPTTSSLSVPATTPVTPNHQSESISPRRRTRKINDCIAMLTGKLQEKLGVPFIDQNVSLLSVLGTDSPAKDDKPQTTSKSTSEVSMPLEKTVTDIPAAVIEIVQSEKVLQVDLPPAAEIAENIRSEKPELVEVSAEQQSPQQKILELQKPIDSPSKPNVDEPLAESQLETISNIDATEPKEIEEIKVDEILPAHEIAASVNATETEAPEDPLASIDEPVVGIAAEIHLQVAKVEIDAAIDASSEEARKEKTPGEETPEKETLEKETPGEETPKEETSKEDPQKEESRGERISKRRIPCEKTSVEIITNMEPVAETVETSVTEIIEASVSESPMEENPSKKIVAVKKTPNRKQKSVTPKATKAPKVAKSPKVAKAAQAPKPPKATEAKVKPSKKAGKKSEIVTTPEIEKLTEIEAVQSAVETGDQKVVADNGPTEISSEAKCDESNQNSSQTKRDEPVSAPKTGEPEPEKVIVEPATVPLSAIEAPVNISIESIKTDAREKAATPKSRKTTSNARRRASPATKSAEKPPVADKSPPRTIVEEVVPTREIAPPPIIDKIEIPPSKIDKIEISPSKPTPKENKKSQTNVKRKSTTAKAKTEKVVGKQPIAAQVNENKSVEGISPPKSKRTTPSSKKAPASAVDSIFESSDEELLPWDPETGFITNQSAEKEVVKETIPAQTVTSNDKKDTPPSTPPIAEKSVAAAADPKPKKKRKNELAQIIADQLLESFKEVDKSRISELKKIHDLSLSSSDDLLTTSLSTTPTPKRKSKKIFENIEPKGRTQSPKVDAKRTPEAKIAKETAMEAVVAKEAMVEVATRIETPQTSTTENSKEAEVVQPKSVKSRNKRIEIDDQSQSITDVKSTTSSPSSDADSIAKTDGISEAPPADEPTKTVENVENVPKKSSGNIFLDGFSETLFGNVDQKATIDSGTSSSKIAVVPSETTAAATPSSATTTTTMTTTTAANPSLKAPVVFGESLFSQQNLKTTRLSDLIGGATNKIVEAATKVSPMKHKSVENLISFDKLGEIKSNARAPFMSPRWDSNAAEDKVEIKNKVNFWGRTIGDDKNVTACTQKSRLFAVIKNKAEKMLTKMSKKKLKKSLKASISSSSSSSTSSSASTNAVPKRPLLRPSILSCNSKRSDASEPFRWHSDGFGGDANETVPAAAEIVPSVRSVTETVPTSDMNIAKIVIALEKSNRKGNATQLQESPEFSMHLRQLTTTADQRIPSEPLKEHQSQQKLLAVGVVNSKAISLLDVGKPATPTPTPTPPLRIPAPTTAPPSITTELLNDSSQDTMISEIVSKIREKVNRTDSDDDLCLAEVAKGLNNRSPSVEFDLTPRPKVNDFSTNFNAQPIQPAVNDESSAKVIVNPSENDVDTADDENTNTEVLDMDLEDDASEYTALSHDTSTTSIGGSKKRKRKKRSILSRNNRRTKKRDDSFVLPAETYFCEVCRKSFKNQSGLTSHKSTITHIAKLSEQEFLEANKSADVLPNKDDGLSHSTTKETPVDADVVQSKSTVAIGTVSVIPSETKSKPSETQAPCKTVPSVNSTQLRSASVSFTTTSVLPVPPKSPNTAFTPATASATIERESTNEQQEMASNFEPISSPEGDTCFNSTPKHTSAALSMNARMTLSQEQRLFYECCSMLKGSDQSPSATHENSKNELASNPITPKTNQHHTNIAHSAQSPRSHPSPRPGIPTLDLNQFSDISSDSNPAYSCPQIPSSSKTQKVFSLDASELIKAEADKDASVATHVSTIANYQYTKGQSQQKGVASDKVKGDAGHRNSSIIVRNYPDTFSDMGDSFPSSQDASESENYAQTILERSVHIHDATAMNTSMRSGHSSKANASGYSLTPVPATINPDLSEFHACSNR